MRQFEATHLEFMVALVINVISSRPAITSTNIVLMKVGDLFSKREGDFISCWISSDAKSQLLGNSMVIGRFYVWCK